jgi:probable HAF family extracellular repeat protein
VTYFEEGIVMSTALSYETIDPPGSTYTFAEGINKQGQIVGFFQNSNGQEYGFLDSGGTYTTIEFPGSVGTVPRAINDKGQIVGNYGDGSGNNSAWRSPELCACAREV